MYLRVTLGQAPVSGVELLLPAGGSAAFKCRRRACAAEHITNRLAGNYQAASWRPSTRTEPQVGASSGQPRWCCERARAVEPPAGDCAAQRRRARVTSVQPPAHAPTRLANSVHRRCSVTACACDGLLFVFAAAVSPLLSEGATGIRRSPWLRLQYALSFIVKLAFCLQLYRPWVVRPSLRCGSLCVPASMHGLGRVIHQIVPAPRLAVGMCAGMVRCARPSISRADALARHPFTTCRWTASRRHVWPRVCTSMVALLHRALSLRAACAPRARAERTAEPLAGSMAALRTAIASEGYIASSNHSSNVGSAAGHTNLCARRQRRERRLRCGWLAYMHRCGGARAHPSARQLPAHARAPGPRHAALSSARPCCHYTQPPGADLLHLQSTCAC
jgi:hypothetical protein